MCWNRLAAEFSFAHLKYFRFRKSYMFFVLIRERVVVGRNTSGEKHRSDHCQKSASRRKLEETTERHIKLHFTCKLQKVLIIKVKTGIGNVVHEKDDYIERLRRVEQFFRQLIKGEMNRSVTRPAKINTAAKGWRLPAHPGYEVITPPYLSSWAPSSSENISTQSSTGR